MAESKMERLENKSWYDRAYFFTVAAKGVDGLIELAAGLWLVLAPNSLHSLLQFLFGHAVQYHGHFIQFVTEHIAHIDTELTSGGVLVVALFLLSHGVVKLALVYALIKEILWAYPYALSVLGGFLLYQIWVFFKHPSIGMFLFCILDAVIIFMVYGEWQKLKREKAHKSHAKGPAVL